MPFFDRALGDEVDHAHRPVLAQAMDAADPLLEHGRVPRLVEIHHRRGVLQVQAHAAGVGRKEQPALRVFLELLDEVLAFRAGHAAVEQHVLPLAPFQPPRDQFVHPQSTG